MGSVVFNDSYSVSGIGSSEQNVRISYSETYHPDTNITDVYFSSCEIASNLFLGSCVIRGKIQFNSSDMKSYPTSTSYYQVYIGGGTTNYATVPGGGSGDTHISVRHDSSGNASFTIKLIALEGSYFGAAYQRKMFGIADGTSKSVSLTRHTSTLTINPNGGVWNGSSSSQSLSQAPTSTRTIPSPTRPGYVFTGWTKSGGGSLSGTTYTYGSSNGTLIANWVSNEYTLTINADAGSDVHVLKGSDELSDGDTIYYNDVLTLSIQPKPGYEIKSRSPAEDTVTVKSDITVTCVTSPMATIHRRMNGAWATYLIYKRYNLTWQLFQANIRKHGQWEKYF